MAVYLPPLIFLAFCFTFLAGFMAGGYYIIYIRKNRR